MAIRLIGTVADQLSTMHHTWGTQGKRQNIHDLSNIMITYPRFESLYRSYISFDILRRVLTNYFGHDVLYVMNITDIDDKIIKRARQNYLYERYVASSTSLEQIVSDHKEVLEQLNDVIAKNTDPDKKTMLARMLNQ